MKFLTFGMVLALAFGCASFVQADENWSPALDRNNIKVWTRAESGHSVLAFKGTVVVKSTLSGLIALILDTANATRWIYRTESVEILQRDDTKASFVVRVITDFPWPLDNRDVVVAGQITQDPKTSIVTINSNALPTSQYPESPGYVRISDFVGEWIFRPLGNGQVEVTMIGRADPAGHIPSGIVNLIIHDTPYQTLRGLRRVIGDERYQTAQFPQIREP